MGRMEDIMKKKIFALGLAAAVLSMMTACTTARNNAGNPGSMAGNGIQTETGVSNGTGTDGTVTNTNLRNDTNRNDATDRIDENDRTGNDSVLGTGGANANDNISLLDGAGNAVSDLVDDAADGVSNAVDDLVGGPDNTGMSRTHTIAE